MGDYQIFPSFIRYCTPQFSNRKTWENLKKVVDKGIGVGKKIYIVHTLDLSNKDCELGYLIRKR